MKDKLPKGWEWKTLGELGSFIRGVSYKKESLLLRKNSESIILLRANNIQDQLDLNDLQFLPKSDIKEIQKIKNNDILFCMSSGSKNLVGKNIVLNDLEDFSFGAFCSVFRSTNNEYTNYIGYFLKSNDYQKQINNYSQGTNILNLRTNQLEEISFPFPPISEQKQIVSVLDKSFEKLDKAISLLEENIQKLKCLNESISDEVFNILLSKKNLVKLGSLSNISAGGTPLRSKNEYWNGNINWFTSGELNEKYIYNSKEYITKKGFENSNTKLFPEGTLLVGMYDTAAFKMSILKEKATCNQAIVGIKPNENFLPEFLYYQLTFLRPLVLNLRQGVRQQNLNSGKIKNIDIYLPSILEQQRIVAYLDQTTEKNHKLTLNYQNKIKALKQLKNSLLDSVFKGELRKAKVISISQPTTDPFFAKKKDWNAKKNADKQVMIIALAMEAHEKIGKSLYRTKGEKTVEVIEKHIDLDFGREAKKMAAGPAAFEHLVKVVEPLAKEKKWFLVQEVKGENYDSHKYIKAENFSAFMMRCVLDLRPNLQEIRRVVDLFANMKTTHEAEVVATTYSGWNNLIIRKIQIDDETIVTEARENWHDSKLKIERQEFFNAIEWLRKNNLVPKGNGKEVN